MEIATAKELQMLEIQTTVHHGHVMHFVLLTVSWEQANLAGIIRRLEDGLCPSHCNSSAFSWRAFSESAEGTLYFSSFWLLNFFMGRLIKPSSPGVGVVEW